MLNFTFLADLRKRILSDDEKNNLNKMSLYLTF